MFDGLILVLVNCKCAVNKLSREVQACLVWGYFFYPDDMSARKEVKK